MRKSLSLVCVASAVLVVIVIGWVFSAHSAATQKGLQGPIHVEGGMVIGTPAWGWGVRLYRGVPYAAPPGLLAPFGGPIKIRLVKEAAHAQV